MDTRIFKLGLGLLGLIGIGVVLAFMFQAQAQLKGAVLEPPLPAPEITLKRSNGSNFRLGQYEDQIVLLFFGYTSCPDVCPATMAELRAARAGLSDDQAEQVQIVFVAVDPERDTPTRIQEYVEHFDKSFIGLSGTEAELQPVWESYFVYREIEESDSAGGYLVSHTARVYLIDKAGALRLTYAFGTPPDDITHDLKVLLNE